MLLVSGTDLTAYGGRERWIMEVAKLVRIFSPATIVVLSGREEIRPCRLKLIQNELVKIGVGYHTIRTIKTNFKVFRRIPLSLLKLFKLVRSHQRIYIAGDIFFGILFSILAFLMGRRGLIIGLHVSPYGKRLHYAKSILKILGWLHIIKIIHVVNPIDLIRLRQSIGIKVVYLPNFVNCSMFKPVSVKRHDAFQVLFIGALEFKKGIDIFLKVAERFKKDFPEAKFVIASYGGSWEEEVLRHVENGLVDYKGFVVDMELIKLYSESHVLMMPSREEPFGLVALEAQACGTPIISSNLPSFRLTVKEGVTGFRVKSYEVDEWVEALRKIYVLWKFDREAYTSMCSRAREHVCKNFYLNIVRSLIKLLLGSEELH
ncbi:MAG: glycosyltransferase family 4 protein [Candidatus Bathyarchaeia archaeon]